MELVVGHTVNGTVLTVFLAVFIIGVVLSIIVAICAFCRIHDFWEGFWRGWIGSMWSAAISLFVLTIGMLVTVPIQPDEVLQIEEAYNIDFNEKAERQISRALDDPSYHEGEIIELAQSIESDNGDISKLYLRVSDIIEDNDEIRAHVELLADENKELKPLPTA